MELLVIDIPPFCDESEMVFLQFDPQSLALISQANEELWSISAPERLQVSVRANFDHMSPAGEFLTSHTVQRHILADHSARSAILPDLIGVFLQPKSILLIAKCGLVQLDRSSGTTVKEFYFSDASAVESHQNEDYFFCDQATISVRSKSKQWNLRGHFRRGVFAALCSNHFVSFDGSRACCLPLGDVDAIETLLWDQIEVMPYKRSMSRPGKSAAFQTTEIPFEQSELTLHIEGITFMM